MKIKIKKGVEQPENLIEDLIDENEFEEKKEKDEIKENKNINELVENNIFNNEIIENREKINERQITDFDLFNTLTSPGEGVTIFTSPYLSAGTPALGEAKGLMKIQI